MSKLPYRPNVCLFILNSDNHIFIGQRSDSEAWQLPQGGAEDDLDLAGNAIREAHEELGVRNESLQVVAQLSATHSYDFRETPDFARGVWRGQDQTFWILKFTGEDSEIDLNKYTPEFKDWKWIESSQLIVQTEDIREEGYLKALPELREYLKTQK